MVWGAVERFGQQHPTTARRILGAALFGLITYAILAGLTARLVDISRESCERGNLARLAVKRQLQAETTTYEALAAASIAEGSKAFATVYGRAAIRAEHELAELVESADSTGYGVSGAVTIRCTDASPRPLPWFTNG